jgi:hypothetical protein
MGAKRKSRAHAGYIVWRKNDLITGSKLCPLIYDFSGVGRKGD